MDQCTNQIKLRGIMLSLPQFSHENHGIRFFRFTLEVQRLSGTVDLIPIVAAESIISRIDPNGGEMISVCGQIRSHNIRSGGSSHLLIFVFASSVCAEDGEFENSCTVEGILCRNAVFRHTPLGREICDVMLAVPRAFHRSDYLPGIVWGRIAQEIANCRVGDFIRIYGRLQSRNYTKITEKGAEERTAYEISALSAEIAERGAP